MEPRTRAIGLALVIGAVVIASGVLYPRRSPAPPPPAPALAPAPVLKSVTETIAIQRGDTLDDLLNRSGVGPPDRVEIAAAVRTVFDVKKFRAGSAIALTRDHAGVLESLAYIIDPDHELKISQAQGAFSAAIIEIPGEIHVVPVCGILQDSLFESMERTGERAELAMQVAEIFGWDLDFYTDPRPGDEFCVLLEKKEYANGQPATYQRILAARYNNAGTVYEGYLFLDGSKPSYYSADGRSLQAAFLRSPLKFEARVSSHFSRRRFHPVLKIYRPHLGTDYAAPTGTPVQAVAAGHVTFTGRTRAGGNTVRIRHANGFQTAYLHLSRIFVRAGQRIEQGQRIAAVGATGLATGPHLDFRVLQNGKYVNFERMKPPRATKIEAAQMTAFTAGRDRYAALIEEGRRTLTASLTPPPAEGGGE